MCTVADPRPIAPGAETHAPPAMFHVKHFEADGRQMIGIARSPVCTGQAGHRHCDMREGF
ncbi:MAG: hypothetical protein B7Y95_07070 [Rhizobiales bacterium 32-66-11]|nr:MAG: hypothetical protein B7Y95_07070 [Rhizobiales bacterium 32-66-11]